MIEPRHGLIHSKTNKQTNKKQEKKNTICKMEAKATRLLVIDCELTSKVLTKQYPFIINLTLTFTNVSIVPNIAPLAGIYNSFWQ